MKPRLIVSSLFFLTVLTSITLLITGSSASAVETTAVLPLSCYDSVAQSSKGVDPEIGCSVLADVVECPASAPNVYYSTKDNVQGDLVVKDNLQTIFCLPDNAPELVDPYKCKRPNGATYYSKLLCLAYSRPPDYKSIYDEIIQCQKDYTLRGGSCFKDSPTVSPSPSPSPMPACKSTEHIRMSDNTCQPDSNCWDTGLADYNTSECLWYRENRPAPTKPPGSGGQCPRKPDPAKGTAEPGAVPAGYQLKEVPSYYLWGCYSQPDKSTDASCTAQATKRTGNITSPCVYGEESIVCPSKGTAYKDGNFLKCAPLKKIAGGRDDRKDDIPPEPVIITQTVERIVTVEVPSDTSVVPPTVVTEESCKTYRETIDEKVISQGDSFLEAADATFKSTSVKNPAFKKVFYEMLKNSAKKSRKLQQLVKTSACNAESITQLQSTVKDFETGDIETVKQTLVFLDKNTKVQNQYVGIQEDFRWIENFAKSLKPDSKEQKTFAEDFKTAEEVKRDFQEILDAEKEGKIFGFEIDGIAERLSEIRKSIESKSTQDLKAKESSLKKGSSKTKKSLKKSAKSGKVKKATKTTKKTSKTKKPVKKTNKK